ncbi:MAG TPA: HAD family hydrolase [Dehalococcoidia bacterium]|nr:HAD family hydrolase [Dehalococcoidia bacterium]
MFDVGGPLDTEIIYEQLVDQHLRAALAAEGVALSDDEYADANRWAVEAFAPNAYTAIIWRLSGGDAELSRRAYARVAARGSERQGARGGFELRPGIAELLADLHGRGVPLGLVANQPADALDRMEAAGIARYFAHRDVSGTHGFRKPDVRVFLHASEHLGVAPEQCIVVGDRIDNDIAPARVLGMRAVLFRTGRHRAQQPRSWEEVPDVEVSTVAELGAALGGLLSGG